MLYTLKALARKLRPKRIPIPQATIQGRRMTITGPSKYVYHSLLPPPAAADFLIARNLVYGRPQRIGACLSQAPLVATYFKGMSKLKVLFVGYGMETYDAQYLLSSGFELDFVTLDTADFILTPSWKAMLALKPSSGIYKRADAHEIEKLFSPESFDAIILGRYCVELFSDEDYISVWNQAYSLLRSEGILIGSVKGIETSPEKRTKLLDGSLDKIHYTSSLGEFAIGGSSVRCCRPRRKLQGFPQVVNRDVAISSVDPEISFTMRSTLQAVKPL